ncbi:MAG: SDR family oxidoreductase [Pseudomonadota bacterium]
MELNDKTIAITGAARGLGAAMAKQLAAQGCKLALIDLEAEALQPTRAACEELGSPLVKTYAVNVADEAAVVTVFANIADDFGALNGQINNAGITRDALTLKFRDGELVSKMSMEQWQAVVDVNLTGVFLCGREAASQMIRLGCEGCLINISSISRHGNIGQLNYAATKAGVQVMAEVWAKEFARYKIRAASIAPGFISTEMVMAMKPEAREMMTGMIPARRLGEPAEIAHAVQFILENDYISGRCIEVDGGLRL